jgi:hypothetical protein
MLYMHRDATQKIFIVLNLECGYFMAHFSITSSKHFISAHISQSLFVKEYFDEFLVVNTVVSWAQTLKFKLESE